MANVSASDRPEFMWEPQPDTWRWLLETIETTCAIDTFCHSLRRRLLEQTGTRLVDWLDHVAVVEADASDAQLRQLGFEQREAATAESVEVWTHPKGLFPQVVRPSGDAFLPGPGLGLKVESVDEFLQVHTMNPEIHGDPVGRLRLARLEGTQLTVVERRGEAGWQLDTPQPAQKEMAGLARQLFDNRSRPIVDAADGFDDATKRFSQVADTLGIDWACSLFFQSEREYWQARNHAARIQFDRQQKLGMGWANHDHHTYRSSRVAFAPLIRLLETMGFRCRERFYAGAEAGWGAQVLEQPVCGIIVFADVDLGPGEIQGDFAHDGLGERSELGTVGMWCKLHGEAIMNAGMHHLECQFDFNAARKQLAEVGVDTMEPFTDFPHLRQAFTVGETWQIGEKHLQRLVADGVMDRPQAKSFAADGARGSHLEILERNDGYKGFNQTGISEIIARTDPRNS